MARRERSEYVLLGRQAILDLLDQEHAAAWLEVEAKVADREWPGIGTPIDPHHLSQARIDLLRAGEIRTVAASTRGGREVTVLTTGAPRRRTAIDRASARKRLLLTRYLGWAQGTDKQSGIIGSAGEVITHQSLVASATFRLLNPAGGQVGRLLGVPLSGPLDNAVIYTPIDSVGLPGAPVTVPIEVKNIRDWIYPSSQELYQLLTKAADAQSQRPEHLIAPVLICRRAHFTAYRMAKDLGFFIIQTRRQYLPQSVPEDRLFEIQSELGFQDLSTEPGPDPRLRHFMVDIFGPQALAKAAKWRDTVASPLADGFRSMQADGLTRRRVGTLETIRKLASAAGFAGGW